MKDSIKITVDDNVIYDKKQIALAIKNSTLNDKMICSLKVDGVLKNCQQCEVGIICEGIDSVVEKYIKDTTLIISEFNFDE